MSMPMLLAVTKRAFRRRCAHAIHAALHTRMLCHQYQYYEREPTNKQKQKRRDGDVIEMVFVVDTAHRSTVLQIYIYTNYVKTSY